MNILSAFKIAFEALRLNMMRSFLAMLGVIIGVGSVIVMVSIGSGAREAVDKQIQSLGANQLTLSPGSSRSGGRMGGAGTAPPFTEADILALRSQIEGIAHISGTLSGSAPIIMGNANWSSNITGVQEDYLEVRDWPLNEGRNFSAQEIRTGAKVALLGSTVVEKIFPEGGALGSTFRIKNTPFVVMGVLQKKGQASWGRDQDDIVLIPLSTARRRLFGDKVSVPNQVQSISIEVASNANMPLVQSEIENVMRARRKIQPGDEDNFNVRNMAEFIQARTATQTTLSLLLAATAGISLVVGGIGIMNIMLVSVTERTREIGIRRALGAKQKDVLGQFLIEAVTLCLTGGFVGMALGTIATFLLSILGSWPVSIDMGTVALAMGSAAFVGIFFGYYPARRAARLNPIEALRYE